MEVTMTEGFTKIDQYLEENLDANLAELVVYCSQPSVSAQNFGLEECADLTAAMLKKRGFTAVVLPTKGAPVVFGERKGRSDKTLLIYNHYDVQPPEPLELWESPPFSPTFRDGKLFARGVSDDKGHLTSRLFAIDAILEEVGELPCNIKFIIEGEEEVGSVSLSAFIQANQEMLSADACIWEFGYIDHRGVPIQHLGLRGLCYVELSVETASVDVHSGLGGSIFPNAAWRLVRALNTLKGDDERIRLPGHYDNVRPPSERDIELMKALPDVDEDYKKRFGVKQYLKGYHGLDLKVNEIFQPTCTICGLTSGYQGPGSKTVLPARASAKVDFRLVPDQDPADVLKSLRSHLDQHDFSDVEITFLGGEPPARTNPDDPFVQMVVESARDVYGHPMQMIPFSGGSGPNHPFIHILNLPVATAGIGYPDTNAHAPNENIRLDQYLSGARHMARIINNFGRDSI
jgi:acetylornithine deacetylase/succinyl-diaminopimelate desuccinylase-like protein